MDPIQNTIDFLRSKQEPIALAIAALERVQEIERPKTEPKPRPPEFIQKVKARDAERRTCSNCGTTRPVSEFPKVGAQCKACISEKAKAYYRERHGGNGHQAEASPRADVNLDAKHRCEICKCNFMGPAQLRAHQAERHSA